MGARASSSIRMGVSEGISIKSQRQRVTPLDDLTVREEPGWGGASGSGRGAAEEDDKGDWSISFGYNCKIQTQATSDEESPGTSKHSISPDLPSSGGISPLSTGPTDKSVPKKSNSFSCLSAAALSANATLANTALGNGFMEEILPGLDSPRTFRKLVSANSLTKLEASRLDGTKLSPSSDNSTSPSVKSPSLKAPSLKSPSKSHHLPSIPFSPPNSWSEQGKSNSAPNRIESGTFLDAADVQTAGGAAGEDRVQAVYSEENGSIFCGIYDGFNGRDAADFLAGTFYESVGLQMGLVEWHLNKSKEVRRENSGDIGSGSASSKEGSGRGVSVEDDAEFGPDDELLQRVMQGLERAFFQTESDFLDMVEQEMEERPELVMVGSCVLAILIQGSSLFTLNVGDSRAVLATTQPPENSIVSGRVEGGNLWAVQMSESHVVENGEEFKRVVAEHPDDPTAISGGRLKGKLKVTRAFGAGYMKDAKLNNALMGILRIKNLRSPPYLGITPCISAHNISDDDSFVVLGSDGLFDFFTNEEVVSLVHNFLLENPIAAASKYMLQQLLIRAAESAGMTVEQLKAIPIGRRRKYHDDVTVIIISLGDKYVASTASTTRPLD